MLVDVVVPVYHEQPALTASIIELHGQPTSHDPYAWRIVEREGS